MSLLSIFKKIALLIFFLIRRWDAKIRNYDARNVSLWSGDDGVSVNLDYDISCIHYSAVDNESSYLIYSPIFILPPGVHEVSIRGEVTEGSCSFGVLDVKRDKWIATQQIRHLDGRSRVLVPLVQKALLQLIISSNNANGAGSVAGTLSQVKLEQKGDRSAAASIISRNAEKADISRWRREVQPLQLLDNLEAEIKRSTPRPADSYGIVQAAEIGYAARSISSVVHGDSLIILVANAGDDTVTLLERKQPGEPLTWKCDLQFPEYCTPIDVQVIPAENDFMIGVSFFHMQEIVSSFGNTGFGVLSLNSVLERSRSSKTIEVEKSDIHMLHERENCRGARNAILVDGGICGRWLAVADRDASAVWIFHQAPGERDWRTPPHLVSLAESFQPVGIAGIMRGDKVVFYVSARLLPQIASIVATVDGTPEINSITDVGGLSRSSIAIGSFGKDKTLGLAVGLWGGKPTEITTPFQGSVFFADISESGGLTNHTWFDAGINTTDVVAGDLDGDGEDELAVLNYGNGLNVEERSHLGDLQIFKKKSGKFECVATLDIPSPRIGLIADFDGDGRMELGVTLFHEKRLAVIKHFT